MTGKRGLSRTRSSSPQGGDGAVAGAVSRDGGCREELTLPMSFHVPAGISKSGASPSAAVQDHVGPTSGGFHRLPRTSWKRRKVSNGRDTRLTGT
jgi:hypothetical protein